MTESGIDSIAVSTVTRRPRGIENHEPTLARVLDNRSLLAWRECPRGSRLFPACCINAAVRAPPASISSSFSPTITPRRRGLHPTLGAHVGAGAPLPPRGWHFPCPSRPPRRRPLRSHGDTTGSCSRTSYIRLAISAHCDKFMGPARPLWLKPMGRNAVEESPGKTTTRWDTLRLLCRKESGTVYLSPWYKGLPIDDDQRMELSFNFAMEFRRCFARRCLGIGTCLRRV